MHQYRFAGPYRRVIDKCLQRGQPGQWQRRRHGMADRRRLNGQVRGGHRDEIGCRTVSIETDQPVDLITTMEIFGTRSDFMDHSGDFV